MITAGKEYHKGAEEKSRLRVSRTESPEDEKGRGRTAVEHGLGAAHRKEKFLSGCDGFARKRDRVSMNFCTR